MLQSTIKILAMVSGMVLGANVFAAAKTLIDFEGGSPKAGLATSWKKVGEGTYEFQLDTSAEVKPGTKLTPAMVKDSLEAKLGTAYGVKVTPEGVSKVTIKYSGDESKFLEQVSKTKIKLGKEVELAMESSVSDGGIRAKAADRPPTVGEVKVIVTKVEPGKIWGIANGVNTNKIKSNEKIIVKGTIKDLKKNELFFFKPDKKQGDTWVPVQGSLQ